MSYVFLGGTCGESKWRETLIKKLKVSYFNPVVDDWNEEARQNELYERINSNYCLYVITPNMEGCYSIAEVVDDSNKQSHKTIFCFLLSDIKNGKQITFNKSLVKSLNAVGTMVKNNGGIWLKTLDEVANYLNNN